MQVSVKHCTSRCPPIDEREPWKSKKGIASSSRLRRMEEWRERTVKWEMMVEFTFDWGFPAYTERSMTSHPCLLLYIRPGELSDLCIGDLQNCFRQLSEVLSGHYSTHYFQFICQEKRKKIEAETANITQARGFGGSRAKLWALNYAIIAWSHWGDHIHVKVKRLKKKGRQRFDAGHEIFGTPWNISPFEGLSEVSDRRSDIPTQPCRYCPLCCWSMLAVHK